MKTIIALIVLVLVAGCGGGGGGATPAHQSDPPRIVVVGDSLSLKMAEYLPGVDNEALSGYTTSLWVHEWEIGRVIALKPSTLLIMLGVNDINRDGRNAQDTCIDYLKILKMVTDKLPNVVIYIQTTLPTRTGEAVNAEIRLLNEMLKSSGYNIIDTYALFVCGMELCEEDTTDGLHLTDQAYAEWADVIKGVLEQQ